MSVVHLRRAGLTRAFAIGTSKSMQDLAVCGWRSTSAVPSAVPSHPRVRKSSHASQTLPGSASAASALSLGGRADSALKRERARAARIFLPAQGWRGASSPPADTLLKPATQAASPAQVVRAGPGAPVTQKWWTKDNPPNMVKVTSVQHFIDCLAEAQDKLVIVEFYAKWCNACRTLFPKVCSLCGPDPNVLILKVDWDDNKDICTALGVKVLPYFQFYRGPVGRIAQFPLSITKVQKLRDALQAFSGPRENGGTLPQLPEFPDTHPSPQLARLPKAANNVVMHSMPSQLPKRQEKVLQTA